MRKINQKGYKFYVVVAGKIESGWDYKEDALEHKADLPDPKAGRILSKAGVKRLGLDPDNNESWLMGPVPAVHEARRGHRVADFNTLDDLVAHAGRELGATHVSSLLIRGTGNAEVKLYFPRGGQYPYEEARTWRKGGYWHAEGPGARTGVTSLPEDAVPIAQFGKPGRSFGYTDVRKASEARGGGDEEAGAAYADDQINGQYFRDWVYAQLVEGREQHPQDTLPLETKEHAVVIARNMLKQLEWDTKRELNQSKEFFRGFSARLAERAVIDWLADELLTMNAEIAGAAVAEAPRGKMRARVDDYEAVDTRDRTIAGPFKQYSDAKDAAGPGGHVKYVPGKRAVHDRRRGFKSKVRPGTAVEITDSNSMYRGWRGVVVAPDARRMNKLGNHERDLVTAGYVLVQNPRGALFVVPPSSIGAVR